MQGFQASGAYDGRVAGNNPGEGAHPPEGALTHHLWLQTGNLLTPVHLSFSLNCGEGEPGDPGENPTMTQ